MECTIFYSSFSNHRHQRGNDKASSPEDTPHIPTFARSISLRLHFWGSHNILSPCLATSTLLRSSSLVPMTYLKHSPTFPKQKRPIPSWILCCLAAASIMTCISISVGWCLRVSDLEGSFPRPPAARSIWFELDLISLDPLQNVVTLEWRIIGDDCIGGTAGSSSTQTPACSVVDIYVNPCVF